MKRLGQIIVAAGFGMLLGILGAHVLWLAIWTLVPWGLAGAELGYWWNDRRPALPGAVFGFALSFSFMVAGYLGKDSLLSRIPPFAMLGLVGGLCGLSLAIVGALLHRWIHRSFGQDKVK